MAGRPTDYREEMNDLVYKFCLLGATDERLAELLDTTVTSLNTWKKKYPEFLASIKKGKDIADAEVVGSLFHRAKGYSHTDTKFATHEGLITDEREYVKHYPPDATSAIFWLKNRQKAQWRDKQDHEHTGPDGGPIEIDNEVTITLVQA